MASPHVAGEVGPLFSQQPDRTHLDLQYLLLESAADLGVPEPDLYFGRGHLDAAKALVMGSPSHQIFIPGLWRE
jgi:hypothetical protein